MSLRPGWRAPASTPPNPQSFDPKRPERGWYPAQPIGPKPLRCKLRCHDWIRCVPIGAVEGPAPRHCTRCGLTDWES